MPGDLPAPDRKVAVYLDKRDTRILFPAKLWSGHSSLIPCARPGEVCIVARIFENLVGSFGDIFD